MDRVGIVVRADLAGDIGFARQRQRLRAEGGLQRVIRGGADQAVDERLVANDRLSGADIRRGLDQVAERNGVERLPAGEEVAFVMRD
ncbi:hypothetical protein D9M72_550490 [compost metagenome]